MDVNAYAMLSPGSALEPCTITRRDPGPEDVLVELLYCGICHTDIIVAEGETNADNFPLVPGHEMVGKVVQAGASVSGLAAGDLVGIGCIADSCRSCNPCGDGDEHYCDTGFSMTFNSQDTAGERTYGGYSSHYTINARYAIPIPSGLDPAAAAPLLCGGITVYTPLKRHGIGPGKKVGVLGLGGLGHLAIKMGTAMGAETVMLTSSPSKISDAKLLGASEAILTSDEEALAAAQGSFDLIIDTISGPHNADSYMPLLAREGVLAFVGAPGKPLEFEITNLLRGDRSISGSLIGGIPKTQEMLAFCAEHGITAEIEMVNMEQVNEAWQRIEDNDVKYRFVLDLAGLK
ncbi:MAG: NAD(P)-dependent alcohol dehydrogenase [Halioglobus sp.]